MATRAEQLAAVLEPNARLVAPDKALRGALDAVVSAGLVTTTTARVFRCFDTTEDGPVFEPEHRTCTAWVQLPDGHDDQLAWNEDAGVIACPSCEREHYPLRHGRRSVERVTIALTDTGCVAWMGARLRELDADARRLPSGCGWRLVVDQDEVSVVWLDRSLDTRLVTRAFATSGTTLYVTTEPRRWSARFRDDPALAPMPLSAWFVDGNRALVEALRSRRDGPMLLREPALRPWAVDRSPEATVLVQPLGARLLVVEARRATLDGVEVLGADAPGLLPVLRVLVARWREDLADGKAPEAHCAWTPDEIRVELARDTSDAPKLDTIRRQITRLRAGIAERYRREATLPIDEDAVVEHVAGGGYRLNPGLLARVAT